MNLTESELRTMAAMSKASDYYMKIYPVVWAILSIGNLGVEFHYALFLLYTQLSIGWHHLLIRIAFLGGPVSHNVAVSVSLVVFLQKDMRRVHSNVYLAFLAVADTVVTNTPAWSGIHELIEGGLTSHNLKFWAKGKLWEYLIQSSVMLSGWLVVVISIDRLVMVYFPLWSKSRLTPRKTLIFTSLTSLPFIIYPIHNLIGRDGTAFFNVDNTSLDASISYAEKFINKEYEHYYLVTHLKYIVPALHVSFFIPLFVLNAAIIYKLFQHARNRNKQLGMAKASDRESIRITIMLVTVNVIALLLRVPFFILHIIAIEPYIKREMDIWWLAFWFLAFEVSYSLLYLNSCINFFIYISMSSNFRKHFMRIFCPFCKKEEGKLQNRHTKKIQPAPAATADTAISETGLSNPSYM